MLLVLNSFIKTIDSKVERMTGLTWLEDKQASKSQSNNQPLASCVFFCSWTAELFMANYCTSLYVDSVGRWLLLL